MTKVNAPAAAPKQLKKNDFLKVIGGEPMTREQIVEALADFKFIPSYLDYLIEHFIAQKKLVRNEDGTINSPNKKAVAGGARKGYAVVEADDGEGGTSLQMEVIEVAKGEEVPDGYSLTPKRAVKVFTSGVYEWYMNTTKEARALLTTEDDANAAEAE